MSRMYQIDITVKLSVCAHTQQEAEKVAMENFQKGKYVKDGAITYSKET